MTTRLVVLLAALVVAAGCEDQPTIPTPPLTATTQLFSGTLPAQDSAFFSFTLTTESRVDLMFASLTPTPLGQAMSEALELGLGTPRGTGCETSETRVTSPALQAQLSVVLQPGTHCANLRDPGSLPAAADFVVRIVQTPTSLDPPAPEDPTTATFESTVAAGGSTSRSFSASQAGVVRLTLERTGPPDNTVVGLGVGIVRGNNTCGLSRQLTVAPGSSPQLEVAIDAGLYCVRVFDVGNIVPDTTLPFVLRIDHP
jgi:hypothetical protein